MEPGQAGWYAAKQGLNVVPLRRRNPAPFACFFELPEAASRVTCWSGSSMVMTRPLSRFFACSSGRSTDGSCGSFMETLGQQIVMLEAALQEAAGAAGVTLTVENGAILITPPP